MNPEEWRPVPGYEGIYSVSDLGNVRIEVKRRYSNLRAGQQVKPGRDRDGYFHIGLSTTGSHEQRRLFKVHRLVWEAFCGPIPPGLQINHKNGVRDDNRLENLELMTCGENIRHSIAVLGKTRKGEHGSNARLTNAQVVAIRERAVGGESRESLARAFGITKVNVRNITKGRTWPNTGGPLLPDPNYKGRLVRGKRYPPYDLTNRPTS